MSMCALIFWKDLKRFLVSVLETIGSFNREDNSILFERSGRRKGIEGTVGSERINVRIHANHFEAIPKLSPHIYI
jgi:hypothetical protein